MPFFGGLLALAMVVFLNVRLSLEKTGTGMQVDISKQIKAGARAFLLTEYLWLIPFIVGCCAYIVVILEVNDIPDYASKTGGWQTMIKYVCLVTNPMAVRVAALGCALSLSLSIRSITCARVLFESPAISDRRAAVLHVSFL